MTLYPESNGTTNADHLISSLVRDEDRVPRERIDECARYGAPMVDALGAVVGPTADWSACESDGRWWLRLHAAFILGLMKDAASGLLLLHMMKRFAAGEDENLEEWLAGYWPALFRNKPDSILPEIEAFAWSHHAQPYMRGHAMEVLLAAAARQGPEALDACLARVVGWIASAQADKDERALVASALLDFPRPAHRPLLESLAASRGERFGIFGMEDIEEAYGRPDHPGWLRFDDPWKFYSPRQIDDRQKRWAEEEERRQQRESVDATRNDDALFQGTYMRDMPKVGRNDPCPCGSGRKYKKCCLNA
jgi:hypothetical protein